MSSALLINEPPLMVQPTLALTVGLNEALFLQQVHYWLNPRLNKNYADGRHWVYNTCDQWKKQFPFFGEKTIRRTIANLEEMNVLISYSGMINNRKTKFYSIDYDVLDFLTDKNTSSDPSGHNDQINLPVWADLTKSMSCDSISESSGDEHASILSDSVASSKNTNIENLRVSEDSSDFLPSLRSTPSGQNDQINLPKRANPINSTASEDVCESSKTFDLLPSGQNDQINVVKMTKSYNKDTETSSETTLPPLNASQKEEEDELDQLILIWNETVQAKLNALPIFLTEKRKITLRSVFKHLFKGEVASWKSYCEKIAGTKFLMGHNESGFKAGFDWAINPDNVAKILEGAIYDKPASEISSGALTELPWEEFANALWARHTLKGYPASWTKVCFNLAKKTNQTVSGCLFEKIHPKDLSGREAELTVPFQFILDQIQQRHKPKLKDAIRAEYPHVESIEIEVRR